MSGASGELSAYGKHTGFAGKECREGFLAEPRDTTFGGLVGEKDAELQVEEGWAEWKEQEQHLPGEGTPPRCPG